MSSQHTDLRYAHYPTFWFHQLHPFFLNWPWWATTTGVRLWMLLMIFLWTPTLQILPLLCHMEQCFVEVSLLREEDQMTLPLQAITIQDSRPIETALFSLSLDALFPGLHEFHLPSPPYSLLSPSRGRSLPFPNSLPPYELPNFLPPCMTCLILPSLLWLMISLPLGTSY